jgi:CYTH domain-containing protein
MIEQERTYLARELPPGLHLAQSVELLDIYLPSNSAHPKLRLRKREKTHEITKKIPVLDNDFSRQTENTVSLTEEEFLELAQVQGKRLRKLRYSYPHNGKTLEIDIFQDELSGLVLVDAEFDNEQDMEGFMMPEFCLAEVTQEDFVAGGKLCGKSYNDIEPKLKKFNYKPLNLSPN